MFILRAYDILGTDYDKGDLSQLSVMGEPNLDLLCSDIQIACQNLQNKIYNRTNLLKSGLKMRSYRQYNMTANDFYFYVDFLMSIFVDYDKSEEESTIVLDDLSLLPYVKIEYQIKKAA